MIIPANNNNSGESLLQESSKWQLTQPYNSKKHSVFVFLFQVCYVIVVAVFIAVGVVSLVSSGDAVCSADTAVLWKEHLHQQFASLELSLSVGDCVRSMVLFKDKVGDDVYFYSNEGKELLLCGESTDTAQSERSFNYTSALHVNFLNHKHRNMHSVRLGDVDVVVRDNEDFFVLKQLCIVINSTELSLEERYKTYKCNGYTPWYESYRRVSTAETGSSSYREVLSEVEEVKIKVLDVNQPGVRTEMGRKEDAQGKEEVLKGSGSVLVALVVILLGLWVCFKEQIEKEETRVAGLRQQIQMETKKKHFDSEDEKNYYYGSDKEDNTVCKNRTRNI